MGKGAAALLKPVVDPAGVKVLDPYTVEFNLMDLKNSSKDRVEDFLAENAP